MDVHPPRNSLLHSHEGMDHEFSDDFTAGSAKCAKVKCVRDSIVNSRLHKRHSVTLFRGGNRRFDRGTFGDTCFVQSRGELLR